MSIVTGDKLYETGFRVLKTTTIIDTLQKSVEFPNVRNLVNEAKLNLDDILLILRRLGSLEIGCKLKASETEMHSLHITMK